MHGLKLTIIGIFSACVAFGVCADDGVESNALDVPLDDAPEETALDYPDPTYTPPTFTVTLRGGHEVTGALVDRGPEEITVRIESVGEIDIPRDVVAKLQPEEGAVPPVQPDSNTVEEPEENAQTEDAVYEEFEHYLQIESWARQLTAESLVERRNAERALAVHGGEVLPYVQPLIYYPDPATRRAVFRILRRIEDARVMELALTGLTDADEVVRHHAAATIRRFLGEDLGYDPAWGPSHAAERWEARARLSEAWSQRCVRAGERSDATSSSYSQ